MTHDFRIGGIILTTIVPVFFGALALTVLVSWVLTRLGFYKLVWHRPLVDVALLVIFFSLIVLLLPDGWPGA